ncbi:lachesin-like [Pollicipes pollicipes]|uniref:lachesin-like n=1 Tax=Pollicipes pollicipes TaxID=41117 RepID=UPI0018855D6D|nr:lachesin-like [Pollicipes pollicipes]
MEVSWFRKQDLHILTLGTHSFTTDSRFKVLHDAGSHDFILRIQAVRTRDAGVYECQVNTEPKLSWPVTLTVQAPHAKVAGPTDLYVQLDSNINLSCELRVLADPPITLTWLRDAAPIDLGSPRAGISIQTERHQPGQQQLPDALLLTLLILRLVTR